MTGSFAGGGPGMGDGVKIIKQETKICEYNHLNDDGQTNDHNCHHIKKPLDSFKDQNQSIDPFLSCFVHVYKVNTLHGKLGILDKLSLTFIKYSGKH